MEGLMALIGYARVSTREQETRLQLDALKAAGVARVFEEKASGALVDRPVLRQCLASLREGDVLVVWKVDRVARSLKHLLSILEELDAVGAEIKSLSEPLDTTTPLGVFVLQSLGAIAQLERSMIRERSIAGQVAALRRGVEWGGRKPALEGARRAEALALRAAGLTQAEVARRFGVHRSTVGRLEVPPKPRITERKPVLRKYLEGLSE